MNKSGGEVILKARVVEVSESDREEVVLDSPPASLEHSSSISAQACIVKNLGIPCD